jgi:hypothetical protein
LLGSIESKQKLAPLRDLAAATKTDVSRMTLKWLCLYV